MKWRILKKNIQIGFDKWIDQMKQKKNSNVNLHSNTLKHTKIIDKYLIDSNCIPAISNQKFNAYLKNCNNNRNERITHHTARKHLLLTVLEILQHRFRITRPFHMTITKKVMEKLSKRRLVEEMQKLKLRIDKI
jgi:hypothetical protein